MRDALLALAALCVSSLGCASQIGLGRARTLEPGHQQVSGTAEIDVIAPRTGADGRAVPLPWVQLGVGYRRGITNGFELQGRAWGFGVPEHLSFGGAVDSKLQIVRSPSSDRGLDVASGLSLVYHQVQLGGTPWHTFGALVPFLTGVNFGRHQFVLGPRAGVGAWAGYGQDTIVLPWFGASTGVSIEVMRRSQLMPEIVLDYIPARFNGEIDNEKRGAIQLQLGLTFSYEP